MGWRDRSDPVVFANTRQLHYYSNCIMWPCYFGMLMRDVFDEGWYRQNTGPLYALTGEVAKALGK